MRNIFIGFIFIFLNFNLTLDNVKIGLLPDFVGYMIMINGLAEMAEESTLFAKVKPYAAGMAIYTGILYLLDLFSITLSLGALLYILAFVSISISLYISYNIVMGVIDIEGKRNIFLNGSSLKSTWTFLAVFNILTIMSLLIPVLTIFFILAAFIAAICFLFAFNKSKNLYDRR